MPTVKSIKINTVGNRTGLYGNPRLRIRLGLIDDSLDLGRSIGFGVEVEWEIALLEGEVVDKLIPRRTVAKATPKGGVPTLLSNVSPSNPDDPSRGNVERPGPKVIRVQDQPGQFAEPGPSLASPKPGISLGKPVGATTGKHDMTTYAMKEYLLEQKARGIGQKKPDTSPAHPRRDYLLDPGSYPVARDHRFCIWLEYGGTRVPGSDLYYLLGYSRAKLDVAAQGYCQKQ